MNTHTLPANQSNGKALTHKRTVRASYIGASHPHKIIISSTMQRTMKYSIETKKNSDYH